MELSAIEAIFSALTTLTATEAATLTLLDPLPPEFVLLVLSALFTLELADGSVPTVGLAPVCVRHAQAGVAISSLPRSSPHRGGGAVGGQTDRFLPSRMPIVGIEVLEMTRW